MSQEVGNQTFDKTVLLDRRHRYVALFQKTPRFDSNLNISKYQMARRPVEIG